MLEKFDAWMIEKFSPYDLGDCLLGHIGEPWHKDYLPGLRWISRKWTSFCKGTFSRPPRWWIGHITSKSLSQWMDIFYPRAIPAVGEWWLGWPLHFAISFRVQRVWHFRTGFRYTETFNPEWNYYSFPTFRLWRDK